MKNVPLILLLVLSLALIEGCASSRHTKHEKTPVHLDDPVLSSLFHRDGSETVRAVATITMEQQEPNLYQSYRVAFAARHPSYLRVEALPSFGVPDFFFSLRDEVFTAFIPSRGTVYTGQATGRIMFSFFKMDMAPDEVVALMTGTPPGTTVDRDDVRLESFQNQQGEYLVHVFSGDGERLQSLRLDSDYRLTELEVFDRRGRLRYQASFRDHEKTASGFQPRHITVLPVDNYSTRVVFEMGSLSLTRNDSLDLFNLAVPSGVKTVVID